MIDPQTPRHLLQPGLALGHVYEGGKTLEETPLCELQVLPGDDLSRGYELLARVEATDGKSALPGTEAFEPFFYNVIPGQEVAMKEDFTYERITDPEDLPLAIADLHVQRGSFISNDALEGVNKDARKNGGIFEDPRGSLTLLHQGNYKRLAMVTPNGEIPESLGELFDSKGSPITSCYSSETKWGEARDKGFKIGVSGIHLHPAQTDRFIFTRGKWEIMLIDLRRNSTTYGRRVFLSFNAKDDDQLAMIIPPGIAHSVACLRVSDINDGRNSATLVNFPTAGYGEVAKGFEELGVSPEVAKRGMELRLDPHRVRANGERVVFSDSGQVVYSGGTVATWEAYWKWLNQQEAFRNKEQEPRPHVLFLGGTDGLLGSVLAHHLGAECVVHSVGLSAHTSETIPHLQVDLTTLSADQLESLIVASGADHIVLTGAWTDVASSIVLGAFIREYRDRLDEENLLGSDPVTQINYTFVARLAQVCKRVQDTYGREVKLILPQTTMVDAASSLTDNYYVDTKKAGADLARRLLGDDSVYEVHFGFPYVVDRTIVGASAKPMTLHKRIETILQVITDSGQKIPAFTDDAVDPTDLLDIVNEIGRIVRNTNNHVGNGLMAEESDLNERETSSSFRFSAWMSSYELNSLIVEVIAEKLELNREEVMNAIRPTQMIHYHPTNRSLIAPKGKDPEQNQAYRWLKKMVEKLGIDIEDFLQRESTYPQAYIKLDTIPEERRMSHPNNEGLKEELRRNIARIVTDIQDRRV